MTDSYPDQRKCVEEHDGNSPETIPGTGIFSYYRDEIGEAGGLIVKFTVRVAGGDEAAALDARQAEAIRELLQWARQHRS
jgi:hypothetical protein